ncbi:MAG: hypothetical protein N3G19_03395 [Candidatus Pacearchaeota archaeon]|nr:hypothetical protein [Candidatus Pacearchaeota archaeon]
MVFFRNPAKTWLAILGLVITIVSLAGLLINLGITFWILGNLPTNPAIYLGIDIVLGIIMLIISLNPMI